MKKANLFLLFQDQDLMEVLNHKYIGIPELIELLQIIESAKAPEDKEKQSGQDDDKFLSLDRQLYVKRIVNKIRQFSRANMPLAQTVSYLELVQGVADSLEVKYTQSASTTDVELAIFLKIAEEAWKIASEKWSKETPLNSPDHAWLKKNQEKYMEAWTGITSSYWHRANAERWGILGDLGIKDLEKIPEHFPKAEVESALRTGQYCIYVTFRRGILPLILPRKIVLNKILNWHSSAHHSFRDKLLEWPNVSIQKAIDTVGPYYRVVICCILKIALMRLASRLENASEFTRQGFGIGKDYCEQCGVFDSSLDEG